MEFANLVKRLSDLLLLATVRKRVRTDVIENKFVEVQQIYPAILAADISSGQREALVSLYHECMRAYRKVLGR